ncbi:MAG TPA: hypothetical protein VN643_11975 [Pyrinomonadaceae bacterium]|nr:hypothetical protein [Pyrinomonadaceae bacterium]
MRDFSSGKWTINEEAFQRWLGNREAEFEPALDPVPTLKALVFLALLDRKSPCTYEELGEIFEQQEVVNGKIPVASLRVATSELGNVLTRFEHQLELKVTRGGQREAKFQLWPRSAGRKGELKGKNSIALVMDHTQEKARDIAQTLLKEQCLPFHSLYYLPRSACWWIMFSSEEAEIRKAYEAGAWEELGLRQTITEAAAPVVGVLGLAIGEGLGEIELLRQVLADGFTAGFTVHYLAVDLSPVLLASHVETVRESFSEELKAGRLICVGILVDVFLDLEMAVTKARIELKALGLFTRGDEFLPTDCPIVATFLGNCLGNDSSDREMVIFDAVSAAFPDNRPLAILVGVSVVRSEPDDYARTWDKFLLQTPHHLLKNLEILRSGKPSDSIEVDEFTLPTETGSDSIACLERRTPKVKPKPYNTRHGIEGQIYRFYYNLDFDLTMPSCGLRLPAKSEIVLYSIIKYDMETLVRGIEKRRFTVRHNPNYHSIVDTENGKREYAVFVAYA